MSYRLKGCVAREEWLSDLCSFGLLHLLKLLQGRSWSCGIQGKIPYTTTFPNCKTTEKSKGCQNSHAWSYIHEHNKDNCLSIPKWAPSYTSVLFWSHLNCPWALIYINILQHTQRQSKYQAFIEELILPSKNPVRYLFTSSIFTDEQAKGQRWFCNIPEDTGQARGHARTMLGLKP